MDNLPDLSQEVLYIHYRGRPRQEVSIVINASWQTINSDLFIVGEWPGDPSISGAFAGKAVTLRYEAIESIIEFDSEEEVREKVFSRSTGHEKWEISDAMFLVGIAIVFGNYIDQVPSDFGWIGWAIAMVGWCWKRQR